MISINDVQVGDIVIVFDEYAHDYCPHVIRVESIENEREYQTETNPTGRICYGVDLTAEEYPQDDYITTVTESNLVDRYMEGSFRQND